MSNTQNGWYKTISNSTLVHEASPASRRQRVSPKHDNKEFYTDNNLTPTTRTTDCGTSTVETQTAGGATDSDAIEMVHQPLHKTFTL